MTSNGSVERTEQIVNPMGFNARPAAEFVKLAGRFTSEIWVTKEDLGVNGKSIMGVLMLAAEQGTRLVLRAEGTDAEEAIDALASLVDRGFEEV